VLLASAGFADVTYTYSGKDFTGFYTDQTINPYVPGDRVTGYLTLPAALPPNTLSVFTPTTFSFSDGYQFITAADPDLNTAYFQVTTDSNSIPVQWDISLLGYDGNLWRIIGAYYYDGFPYDTGAITNADILSEGWVEDPGAWSVRGIVPETSSLVLLGTGAFTLVGTLRRRLR
jgi:hypothetical protein